MKSELLNVAQAVNGHSSVNTSSQSRTTKSTLARRAGIAVCVAFFSTLSVSPAFAQIEFEETTSAAAKFDDVESWGASWGDMNGDLWPDLFVTNHRMRPSLFRNNGDGTFTNVVLQWDSSRTWLNDPLADEHGGSWSDFDEDGDMDLSVITGIAFDGHLFVNSGDNFVESGAAFGLTDDREGRLPLWFDYNNDGNIDLAYTSGSSARMFEWTPNPPTEPPSEPFPYKNVSDFADSKLGHWCFRNQYGFLIDLDGDDVMELVCASEGNFPQHALDYETGVFEINTELLTDQVSNAVDSTTGDFNGDLLPDILVMRGNLMPNEAQFIPDANGDNKRIESWVSTGTGNGVRTIQFRTTGPVDFTAMSNQIAVPWRIFIGASATPLGPTEINTGNAITPFTLDPSDPANWGIASEDPVFNPDDPISRGTFVGYDPVEDLWSVTMAPGDVSVRALYVMESANLITDLNIIGTALRDGPVSPAMLINTTTGVDSTPESMFNPTLRGDIAQQMMCVSATTGDFDNDMDLDIYVVCRGGVENLPNRLFENDGTGFFTEVTAAGGAEGLIGLGLQSEAGTGESVVMADYDIDGLLDIFVTNGLNLQPFREGAQDQLFRNKTDNGNHWVLIDLQGTTSNRDGVGATLYATTPDGTVQLREQNGGYHRWSQHHTRVHFGLGNNTRFNLDVRWPSGLTETFTDIDADQLIRVVEGDGVETLVPGPAVGDPAVQFEDRCGSPRYQANEDIGLFVWKDCATDIWTVELISGDSETPIAQGGYVASSQPLLSVESESFESNDILDNAIPEIINFQMAALDGGRDAFTFELAAGAGGCLVLNTPAIEIFLGADHVRAPSPLNVVDPSAGCLLVTSADVSVNEGDGDAEVIVSLSEPAAQPITLQASTVDGTATSTDDYSQFAPNPALVSFPIGAISQTLNIPITDDSSFESDETFSVVFSNVSGAGNVPNPVTVTIVDNDASPACGKPSYDPALEQQLSLWKDCGTENWHLETSAGGATGVLHTGTLTSNPSINAWAAVSFEANDFTSPPADPADPQHNPTPDTIDYTMTMSGAGIDGLDFTVADTAATCLTTADASIPIVVGAAATVVTSPFDIHTLQPCITVNVDISIGDISITEDAGTASVPVTISESANVSVEVSTLAGTADAVDDFLPISAQSISFVTGGPVTQLVDITIIDDPDVESTEQFNVNLSNVIGATPIDASANVDILDNDTVTDPVCGRPSFDSATDQQLSLWKDCGTENWHIEASAGGGTAVVHTGSLASDVNFSAWSTVSFESNDFTSPPADPADPQHNPTPDTIDYNMTMSAAGTDILNFTVADSAATCLTTVNASIPIIVGAADTVVTSPFDIHTLQPCVTVNVDISIGDVSITEDAGTASVPVTISETANVSVDVSTIAGTADAVDDFLPISAQSLSFVAGGPVTQMVDITIVDDPVVEATEQFNVNLSNIIGATPVDASANVDILDNDTVGNPVCGEPSVLPVEPNSARALYIWNDCGTDQWFMRATSGDTGVAADHLGSLQISNGALVTQTYLVNPPYDNGSASSEFGMVSFEGVDLFDTSSSPIAYRMRMNGAGYDGVDFAVTPGSLLCLTETNSDASLQVLLGANATPAPTGAFELTDPALGACSVSSTPSVTIDDVSIMESAGTAVLTLTLSDAPATTVSVSAATADGSADAGSDYTAIPSQNIVFTAGGPVTQTLSVSILDDTQFEASEDFTVNLSNASGLVIADASALVTIIDDDTNISCGEPSYDPATDRALFMWRECGTRVWQIRASAAGPVATHQGQINVTGSLINQSYPANVPYDFTIVQKRFAWKSFEGIDVIIAPPGSNPLVEYTMRMSNAGYDGFEFEANPGTILCMTNLSPSLPILLGSQRIPMSGQGVNPDTNQACN